MKYKDRRALEENREEILAFLPTFINHLLLLLNSGMVLQEAMNTIASKYMSTGLNNSNVFAFEYTKIYLESKTMGKSIVGAFNDYCKKSNVKELSRIGIILFDGDKRGIDLCQKLSDESKFLWEQRKQMALDKIRLSESKMSFPLGLLLIALILISAAPAMMQMYI